MSWALKVAGELRRRNWTGGEGYEELLVGTWAKEINTGRTRQKSRGEAHHRGLQWEATPQRGGSCRQVGAGGQG